MKQVIGTLLNKFFFKKIGQSRPFFVYFRSFLVTISIKIEKSLDGVHGIQNWGRRMVGADETTELWRPHRPGFVHNSFSVKKKERDTTEQKGAKSYLVASC